MNSRPLVVILSRSDSPVAEAEARIEREILADAASVQTIALPDRLDPGALPQEVLDATAIIIWHSLTVDAAAIGRLDKCRALIRNGVGFDSIDIAAAAARGISVCNVPDYGTEEVADHAIALALALCRRLFPLDAEAKRLGWRIEHTERLHRLSTLVFGIVGLGRIGTATALRAKALGFHVVFHDPYVPSGTHKAVGVERVSSLEELLRRSDVVSIHCPLNAETAGLIGSRQLALMKPTAHLVNTARGGIVSKAAAFAALRAGTLAGAGFDVIEDEPLRTAEEAATPNLIATCHAAFCSVEGMIEMRSTSARIARAAVLGQPVWNRVN
jgi:phosphoglycerate dehydrogenase-like enzyme